MPLILPSNSISAVGYEVDNSLRFDDGFSDRLIKTFSTSGNQRTVTFSTWFKISALGTIRHLFSNSGADSINLASNDTLEIQLGGSAEGYLYLNRVFRDPSAWYHIVFNMDTTQSTASNRLKVYINGIQETSFSATSYPTQNLQTGFSENVQHSIGSRSANNDRFFDGYMTETVFIDGQQLDPTSFGEFDEDTGIWKPIDVSGLTFGTNGFYLDFENSGSLGADVSGNGNNFTVNNLTSIDQTTDTPTNNYCTFLGELEPDNETSHAEGNTKAIFNVVGSSGNAHSSIAINNNGKWYAEFKISGTPAYGEPVVGINDLIGWSGGIGYNASRPNDSIGYLSNGNIFQGGSLLLSASSFTNNDIIQVAFDGTTGRIYFGKNGTWQNSGDPSAGTGYVGTAPMTSDYIGFAVGGNGGDGSTGTQNVFANFGNPAFTISSGNSDGNGYGNFEYSVPSGYYALNSKNLAEYG